MLGHCGYVSWFMSRLIVVQSYKRKQAIQITKRIYIGLSKPVDRSKQFMVVPVVANVRVIG